jgi:tellurite resistance protein TerC
VERRGILLGLSFSLVIYLLAAGRHGSPAATRASFEYLTGYLVEESLSIDNMFVFAMLFRYFSLDAAQQHRVLFYGIVGAMAFRGIFVRSRLSPDPVPLGSDCFRRVSNPERSADGVRIRKGSGCRAQSGGSVFPAVRPGNGQDARDPAGFPRCYGIRFTPLLVVLLVVESTDIMFAVDSVPAVFAVTREPLVVYTSNIFAILGLRAIYLTLAGALDRFRYLKYGLSVVLVFVSLKMAVLDDLAGGRFPIALSLAVIASVLTASIAFSAFVDRKPREPENSGTAMGRIALGSIFAALCAASLALAVGVQLRLLGTGPLEEIRAEWLYLSGIGHGVCAWLLLGAARRKVPREPG